MAAAAEAGSCRGGRVSGVGSQLVDGGEVCGEQLGGVRRTSRRVPPSRPRVVIHPL